MSQANGNPFAQADWSKMFDMTKMMDMMRMPSMNMESFVNAQRKQVEAITALNQSAYDSIQTLARRQAELVRQSMEDCTSMIGAIMACPTPEEKVMKQAEVSRVAMEKCITNVREITDTIMKCNNQAIETVSSCMTDSIEELRSMMRPTKVA